jgi:transcriptional/translational regulatory protein YebC/TACO1
MSRYLTTATNEFEADMILERLAEAGVRAVEQGTLGPRAGGTGALDIHVEERDLDRAREALKAAEDVSDEELTQLSQRPSTDDSAS